MILNLSKNLPSFCQAFRSCPDFFSSYSPANYLCCVRRETEPTSEGHWRLSGLGRQRALPGSSVSSVCDSVNMKIAGRHGLSVARPVYREGRGGRQQRGEGAEQGMTWGMGGDLLANEANLEPWQPNRRLRTKPSSLTYYYLTNGEYCCRCQCKVHSCAMICTVSNDGSRKRSVLCTVLYISLS